MIDDNRFLIQSQRFYAAIFQIDFVLFECDSLKKEKKTNNIIYILFAKSFPYLDQVR